MDFVAKKAFQSKVKKFGEELGVNQIFSTSADAGPSSSAPSPFDGLHGNNDGDNSNGEIFPSSLSVHFDNQPNNFPAFLNLFYVDRSILSVRALASVTACYQLLCATALLLLLNVLNNSLLTIFNASAFPWFYILLSAVSAALIAGVQLVAYETAFRGAYRTSRALRLRFLFLAAGTVCVTGVYAFVGVGWLNGWFRLSAVGKESVFKTTTQKNVCLALVVVEALGWTAATMLTMYCGFDFYDLYATNVRGLSDAAGREAEHARRGGGSGGSGGGGGGGGGGGEGGGRERGRDKRMEAIREKYAVGR